MKGQNWEVSLQLEATAETINGTKDGSRFGTRGGKESNDKERLSDKPSARLELKIQHQSRRSFEGALY